ncbi:MAG: 1,2-phenylacetyl-CoA epoxidase subunit PaaD [Saprospiraceae bacterium]
MSTMHAQPSVEEIYAVLQTVPDPEVPVISVLELGIIREVVIDDSHQAVVTVTPTYSGCPAIEAININIISALQEAGFKASIKSSISPPWSTDDITPDGRAKLLAYGIAPPNGSASKSSLLGDDKPRACPLCESTNTELLSQFGSTACKALYRCIDCREPFDYFKCH